jgi:yecA family protein
MSKSDPLKIIDKFLLSDQAPENSMGISDLDGFLTGIVVGPELVLPGEWLSRIWGGESPRFKSTKQADRALLRRRLRLEASFVPQILPTADRFEPEIPHDPQGGI